MKVTNATFEGFKENVKAIVTSEDVREREKIKWKIVDSLPNVEVNRYSE